jgi:mycoredoxin
VRGARGTPGADAVLVYWRPGCPYCAMLRLGFRAARLPAQEINIWEDRAAAAYVRAITGGNETVPTVIVGSQALVNPTARQVIAAARAGQPSPFPADAAQPASWLAHVGRVLTRLWPWPRHGVDEHGRPTTR